MYQRGLNILRATFGEKDAKVKELYKRYTELFGESGICGESSTPGGGDNETGKTE